MRIKTGFLAQCSTFVAPAALPCMAKSHTNSRLIASTAPPTECARCPVRARALFQGVPLDQLEWTQQYRSNQFTLKPRSRLFDEGDQHEYAYTLFSGWVMLSSNAPSGRRRVLRFALPGDFVGFQPRLDGPMTYSAFAITESRLCAFPRKKLGKMLAERSDLASRMATLSARDMAFMQQLIIANGHKSARERIVALVMLLFIQVQTIGALIPGTTDDVIDFPLSQDVIADTLAMEPETVNRTLRDLRTDGIFEIKQRRLKVIDRDQALSIAELDMEAMSEQMLL